MNAMPVAIAVHLLSAVVWVGGMFFAYMALRPAATDTLEPPHRLPLWCQTFAHFFPWVWIAVVLLPATGYWMTFKIFGGIAQAGWHVVAMQVIGIPMILIYLHLYFAPYRRLHAAVASEDWPGAGKQLATIRKLVGLNLLLGLCLVAAGGVGRYW